MTRTVIHGCRALIGEDAELSGPLDVTIEGTRIADIRPMQDGSDPDAIDARNCLLTAGLINGHFHSHEHFQKGRFEKLPLELWMNYVRPPRAVQVTPRQVYLRTMIGAIEALRSGTTTVVDDVNIGASLDRAHLAAVHQAYEDIGLRALVGISMMDRPFFEALPFVEEEFAPDLLAELRQIPIASGSGLLSLARELATVRNPAEHRVGFIMSPSAPQRCTTPFLQAARSLADEFSLPMIIHVQETRLQVVTGLVTKGKTFVEYLHEIGFLGPNTSLIHGVWLTPREIGLIADAGTTVQLNPWSNLRLGSGIAPFRALLDAGVNVSLGTDGCSSTDTCNILHSLGLAAALQSLRGDHQSWIGADEAWRSATTGGAKAIGRGHDLGAVKVGHTADLVLFRLDRIPFVPLNNALQQLVYAERGASVDSVLVDGRVVMRGGKLACVDEDALLAEIASEFTELAPRIAEAESSVQRMRPALERIHDRCLHEPISDQTFPARLS
jgi:5-methylthioadenosine/S-adenosylhomocysteine deaminase